MKESEDELIHKIGEHLHTLRTEKGLSQMDVASAAGIDKSAYQRIERGRTNPSIKMLDRVVRATGTSLRDFFSTLPQSEGDF